MKLKDAIRTMRFKDVQMRHNQLYTQWGENLDPEHILQEYPRPQLKRDNYTILNGYWDYCITKEALEPVRYDGRILVPFSPESVLSGVNRQVAPGEILWYRRILLIPEIMEGKRFLLHFGAVDQCCEIYINGEIKFKHVGGYLPFTIDITGGIRQGENTLIVKVIDDSDTSFHSRGKQKLDRGGMFYTAQSGIWQTVWMEWVPSVYISSLKITPRIDKGLVEVSISLNKSDFIQDKLTEKTYRVEVYDDGEILHSIAGTSSVITVPMPDFTYWSPENPYLYDLTVTACDDRVESYFAMRCFEFRKDTEGINRLYLNNEPYFQNGILDQGYWPDGLYTAPSDEAFIFDIGKMKELGFNMIRKHLKIEPLRWYYHCDRLGMIVWQDMVNGGGKYSTLMVGYLPTILPCFASHFKDRHYRLLGRGNVEGRKEWIAECRQTVELLYNHPSIAVWVPFNEGWGQFDAAGIYEMIKAMDGTRLIDHASGWFDQKCGDFKSIHNYFHPLAVPLEDRPTVLSEFGGFACYIGEHSYSWQIYGYRIYPDSEELNKAFQSLYRDIESLKRKGLSAAVFTQLSDVEDEVNGLLTYDRRICKVDGIRIDNQKS